MKKTRGTDSSTPRRVTRSYRSSLRTGRAQQTHERILDALVAVMARDGIADISIPLIAREARVSIPCVYRHFPTKRHLLAALDEYAYRKGSFKLAEFGPIETPEELADIIPESFRRGESVESTLSAAMTSRLGYPMGRTEFEERKQFVANALKPVAGRLGRKERAWLTEVVFILNSFATVRAFKDYLGLNTEEAARRVAWAIRALSRGAAGAGGSRSS